MDYVNNKRIKFILGMNLFIIGYLSVIIYRCIRICKEKRKLYEKTSTLIIKEIFTYPRDVKYPSILLLAVSIWHFYSNTLPFIMDIPYMGEQNYEEASGTITQCDTNEIVAEVTYRDNITKSITITGSYDLNGGEKIIVKYLPHANIRMKWYIVNDETGETLFQETAIDSLLLDNSMFMMCLAVGSFLTEKFIELLYLLKSEEDIRRHQKILGYAQVISCGILVLSMAYLIV